MDEFKTLGKYLRNKRRRKGLNQSFIATQLGYNSPQFISNFERDLCAPAIKSLPTLSELYDIPLKELIDLHIEDMRKRMYKKLNVIDKS